MTSVPLDALSTNYTLATRLPRVKPGKSGHQFWTTLSNVLRMVHGSRTVVHMKLTPLYEGRLDVRLISAQALRQYMTFRGYSVRSLAKRVGVSHGSIGWLTSGQRTTTKPETAKAIAKALDCPVESLFVPVVVNVSRTAA